MKHTRKVCKNWDNLPMLMDVDITALALNVSALHVYKLCSDSKLPAVRPRKVLADIPG